jgi:ribosomal protein S18 acetylase RimI-like enzyme
MSCKYKINNQVFNSKEELKEHFSQRKNITKDIIATFGGNTSTTITPYKGTDMWVGVAFRRILKLASDEGYSGIAFATGQQSADMYSLSNQVDKIEIEVFGEGRVLEIFQKNNRKDTLVVNKEGIVISATDDTYSGKKAEDVLGKELTKKILETTEDTTLEGEGLEFGGEGMKTFYDKIVPKVVKKEAQRFDKNAKLETVDFGEAETTNVYTLKDIKEIKLNGRSLQRYIRNAEGTEQVTVENLQKAIIDDMIELLLRNGFVDIAEARNAATENDEDGLAVVRIYDQALKDHDMLAKKEIEDLQIEYYETAKGEKDKLSLGVQPYLPLTQSIKDSVSQGIPQFQKSGVTPITNGFIYKNDVYLNKNADESTMVHEFNHLYNKWLKQNRPEVYKKGLDLVRAETSFSTPSVKPILEILKNLDFDSFVNYDGMFSKTTAGTSVDDILYDSLDGKKGYFYYYKREQAKIQMMSPADYLKKVREGFGTQKDENLTDESRANILKGVEKGDKINMPYLDYRGGKFSQEGRNRAKLALERGEKLIPVMVIESVKESNIEDITADMISDLTDRFYFDSKEQLLDALKDVFKLHRDPLNYIENTYFEDYVLPKTTKNKVKYRKSEIQDIIDFVKTNQPNLEGEALQEEILTELVGRRGLELLNEQKDKAKSSGIIDYLKQVWQEIKNMLGLSSYTDEQILNMNLQDFAKASAVDLLSGERLKKDKAIKRNNGNPLNLAPNGKPSILYQSYKDLGYSEQEIERLVAQVYSDSFFQFFGDWLNNPQNASKVVDENGQPLLVWHYTRQDFSEFDIDKARNSGYSKVGFWFGSNKEISSQYGTKAVPSFLNIEDEKIYNSWYDFTSDIEYIATKAELGDEANYYRKVLSKEYDGVVLESVDIDEKIGEQDIFVAFNPNQIKSATENVGTFSEDSNDIRFSQIIPTFKGNDDIERIKKLNKKGNEDGATFNLDGSTYDKGGLIIPVISLNTTQKELSKELIEKFIQENSSKIGADNIKVGIFKFEDSNEVSIDLNVVVDAKYRDIGLTFGKYAGQESLFDLSTFLPAKTGADGKNPKNFTDEEFRDIANSLSEGKLPSFLNLSPQTSTNYANLTEDGEGNFVFYHVGAKGYDAIKRGTGQNIATSREEATAINRVGGVAMYYPAENVQESMFSGEAKYLIKVPQEKVYDFNRDALNLLDEAEQMFRKQFPNQAFDKNSKLAFVTKVANEKGFDAVVANWDSTTRVQTTKELKPLDEQITEGNKIVKDFSAENKFKSNKDKGWKVVPTVMQSKLLKDVYDKIETLVGNDFSNPLYRVREMAGYTFEDRFAPFKSQDEITDVVEKSNLPQEVKDEYTQAVTSQDKPGYSKLTKKPSLKIEVKEVNGRLVVEPLVNGTKAGALRMLPYEDGYRVDSVAVYDKYQNKRLGTRLYQEAIKFLLKSQTPLYSLKVRSENAKKIWDKFVEIGVAQKVGEDYIAPNKGGLDKNNEAAPSDVMQYANTTEEKLSKEETAEAIDLAVSLGVESSQEAVAILKDAFLENNSFVFDKKKMKKAGYNDYEITKILTDVNLQNQIKNNLAKLENTDFSAPLMDAQTSPEIGIFGKQKVKPKVKTGNVKTVNEQGEVVDKVSDTKELLRKTYPDTLPNDMPQIASSLLKSSENVVNTHNELFYKTLNDLKDAALDLGVDLKDIENRVFPLENFKSFVNSLMEYYANPSDAFAEVYDEFFENYGTEKATKPTMSTPYTEYELFDKFNLVRNGDEYVKVEDVEIEPSAERQAKIPQLEVEDFAVDFDKLEKLVYHKEQLGAEMKTLQKPLVEEINLKEIKKNPYLKATSEGVKLVSEDPLTAQKAELYGYEPKVAEKQPKKIETNYSLVQDVLVTQLTSENKVRTPKGNFTKFMDDNNKSVFLLDGSKQSAVDLEGYLSKADNTPKIEAKKLYSKEEYQENFGCV